MFDEFGICSRNTDVYLLAEYWIHRPISDQFQST
jgi:hypothetical protein